MNDDLIRAKIAAELAFGEEVANVRSTLEFAKKELKQAEALTNDYERNRYINSARTKYAKAVERLKRLNQMAAYVNILEERLTTMRTPVVNVERVEPPSEIHITYDDFILSLCQKMRAGLPVSESDHERIRSWSIQRAKNRWPELYIIENNT